MAIGMIEMVVALAESDCERLRPGWLAQPANAISSVAYVAVGVWLLWNSVRGGVDRQARLAAGCAMVGAGVGSVMYHGPQPGWASPAHDVGVWSLAAVITVQSMLLLARPITRGQVLTAWRSTAPWMAPALVAYIAGRAGSPLCHPAALLQLHAIWHVLSAVALGWLVRGYATK